MTAALEKVVPLLADLTVEDRDELRGILNELDGDEHLTPEEWEEAWAAEAERRLADVEAGRSKLVSWVEIKAVWKERRA